MVVLHCTALLQRIYDAQTGSMFRSRHFPSGTAVFTTRGICAKRHAWALMSSSGNAQLVSKRGAALIRIIPRATDGLLLFAHRRRSIDLGVQG